METDTRQRNTYRGSQQLPHTYSVEQRSSTPHYQGQPFAAEGPKTKLAVFGGSGDWESFLVPFETPQKLDSQGCLSSSQNWGMTWCPWWSVCLLYPRPPVWLLANCSRWNGKGKDCLHNSLWSLWIYSYALQIVQCFKHFPKGNGACSSRTLVGDTWMTSSSWAKGLTRAMINLKLYYSAFSAMD